MIKLHKFLVENRIGSQKHCENLIKNGAVTIDGNVCTNPVQFIDYENQIIAINGEKVEPVEVKYLLLYKPKGYLSHYSKWDRNIYQLIPQKYSNLHPVGRLDKESEGLMILTNDGKLNNFITRPDNKISKTYWVHLDSFFQPEHVRKLFKGVYFAEGKIQPFKVKIIKRARNLTICIITIYEGKKREIRRAFARFGYKIRNLKRIAIGRISLNSLKPGQYKEVTLNFIMNNLL